MNIVYFLLVGLLAGYLGGKIMRGQGFGWFLNIIIGTCGAFLGAWLFSLTDIEVSNSFAGEMLTAFIGSIILLLLLGIFRRKRR